MDATGRRSTVDRFKNPLEGIALGDPFVLRHRGRFYLYGTNDGPPLADGREIPVFRSDDMIHWEPLGGALEPMDRSADHWAPEVLAWNGQFFMVVSFGDVDRKGHALWVAVADQPEGPFQLRKRISAPDEQFSIDGSWLLDDDGRLYLFRCLDFIAEADLPHGTGIVVQEMRDPFTPIGAPATVLRAHVPWQLFEANRSMPLYGGRTFQEWTTIEGPAPVRRLGKYFCGYSGGNFSGAYGTGEAVADAPLGPYRDTRGQAGPIFGTIPGLVEGPGHFSVVQPDLVHDWIVLHGRRPGESVRSVWLCPATWSVEGLNVGPLTDRPQAAPPLSQIRDRFDGPQGLQPIGWTPESGDWRLDGDGLRQRDPQAVASLWRDGRELAGDWVAEVYVRLPETPTAVAGLILESDQGRVSLELDRVGVHFRQVDGQTHGADLPTLGDEAFDHARYHAMLVRRRSDRVEVRLDGVLVIAIATVPRGDLRLALYARGVAAFDALSVTGAHA
ncbi:MAG: glycoside hydrolase [Planctomycetota bacterium]|nr:glycoside hydrolase [Planctomycetota bacterium]